MRRILYYIGGAVGGLLLLGAILRIVPMARGAWVALRASPLATGENSSVDSSSSTVERMPFSVQVAGGLSMELLARGVVGARVIAEDEHGDLWVSQTSPGTLYRIIRNEGSVRGETVLKGLRKPHGLAFDPIDRSQLYITTERALLRFDTENPSSTPEKIIDFPEGGRHTTRTLLFGKDGFLYISIGSSCDVCFERDERLGTVMRMDVRRDKPVLEPYARGLRNAVFMTNHPITGEIIATEMGRDFLGDALPPDEINIVKQGAHYGWPLCYGSNIHDKVFDTRTTNPCREPVMTPSWVDLPAHSAPLGLAFAPRTWGERWRGMLFVALHGSWNSTQPVGYKIIAIRTDDQKRTFGSEDIVRGFITPTTTYGRPVDLVVSRSEQEMFVSDDKAGAIYIIKPDAGL